MILIIITGILSFGIIPLASCVGWLIEHCLIMFGADVCWNYWQQAIPGFLFMMFTGGIKIKIG
jgi:hypothetical protein